MFGRAHDAAVLFSLARKNVMSTPVSSMRRFQLYLENQLTCIQHNPHVQKVQGLPPFQRYGVWFGIFLVTQLIIFALLYVFFGSVVVIGLFASILAGLATGVGALPALWLKEISNNVFNSLLGAAAGVMLAATAFSLLVPGLHYGDLLWAGRGVYIVSAGMMIGAFFLHYADKQLPHVHFDALSEENLNSLKKVWLFIMAITIHNFPEGMSVGVSFGSGNVKDGLVLAGAISLQNIPEGLAVALPLVGLGYNKWKAVGIATLTGLVEPIGGLLGVTMVSVFEPLLPIAMGFAAGAMLFVISEEIIPQTHSQGRSRYATFSLMTGFIVMMMLDTLLG
jgi:ZIP family zinc transporter